MSAGDVAAFVACAVLVLAGVGGVTFGAVAFRNHRRAGFEVAAPIVGMMVGGAFVTVMGVMGLVLTVGGGS